MKKWLILLILGIATELMFAQSDSTDIAFAELKPEPEHRRVSQLVTTILQRNH